MKMHAPGARDSHSLTHMGTYEFGYGPGAVVLILEADTAEEKSALADMARSLHSVLPADSVRIDEDGLTLTVRQIHRR